MNKSIKVNATLNVIRTLMSVLFPLITYPYILRVLDTEGIGKVSYVSSVVSYFTMFAMLGVTTYAVREGAKFRDDKEKFTILSSQIFSINIISTALSYCLLIITVLGFKRFAEYKLLFFILGLSIGFQVFSVDWLNIIFEDFTFITIRTILIYIINLILVFVVIKKPDDYLIYAILTVMPSGLICLFNWVYCRRFVKLHFTLNMCMSRHLKPLLVFFANALAISVYVNFDITMLGWYKGDYYAGIYTVSAKIYNIIKATLGAIYAVTVPRLAFYVGTNDYSKYKLLYSKTWGILSIVLLPAVVGIFCLAKEVVVILGGMKYVEAADSLRVLSFALVFAIFGGLITACLNNTIGREEINLRATIISAVINFLLNLRFIPLWGTVGAAITTVISEFVVLVICFLSIKNKSKYFDEKIIIINLLHSALGAVLISFLYLLVSKLISNSVLILLTMVFGSVAIYGFMLVLLKNELFMGLLIQILNIIRVKH